MDGNRRVKEILPRVLKKLSTRPGGILTIALLVGSLSFLIFQCYYSPDVPFLFHDSDAAWIRYPSPISIFKRGYTSDVHFSKEFTIEQNPAGEVSVHLMAFGQVSLYVNENPVFTESPGEKNLKKERQIQVTRWIKRGMNTLRAHVQNPMGPALLRLKIEGLRDPIITDETWKVRFGSDLPVQAALADDTRINPDSLTVPTSYQSLREKGQSIFLIFLASIGVWAIGRLFLQGARMRILPGTAFTAILMGWVYCFLAKMAKIDPFTGFDPMGHLDYIFYIIKNQRIPLATEGWSMFHPPFFYLLSARFLEIINPFFPSVRPFHLLKVIPFLCGLGNVGAAYALGRLIFKGDPLKVLFVVVMAGILPMNIYMSAYVGNEPLHALLVGLSLLTAVHIFRSFETRFSQMLILGLLLGLAVLTKITAWAILPAVAFFLAYKMIRLDRKTPGEVLLRLGLLFVVIGVISGWYYVRNIIHFGHPFMINWNLAGQKWWQDPGFHTIKYYLGFGEALRHPYFSSFHSFWDSLYSTFWGDGLIGGKAFLRFRPAVWNYDYMSAVYLLALPAVGILVIGFMKAVQMSFREKESGSRLIMAFLIISVYSFGFFLLFSTLRVPVYGQAKAFYCLAAMGPISVFFALGLGRVNDWLSSSRLIVIRALFYGWLGTLSTSICLSFAG